MEHDPATSVNTDAPATPGMLGIRPPLHPAVPVALAERRHGRAWLISLAAHIFVLVLALWGLGRKVTAPSPPVRVVFVEPPPPPPPLLGVSEGKGSAPIAETPPQEIEKLPPPAKPEPKPPKRLVTPKQIVKLKEPKPPPPVPVEPPATASTTMSVEAPQAGVATGSVEGLEDGIPGGVKGETIGDVKGGVIAAPVRADQVAHPPVLVSRVDPDYPEVARLREIEGRVVLEAIVDREGRIEPEIKVLKSVAVLDKAAIEALKHWRFTPGRDENGQAVRVILEVPIRFVLE